MLQALSIPHCQLTRRGCLYEAMRLCPHLWG